MPFERNLHREHQFEGIAKAKAAAFIMPVKKNRGSEAPVITGSLMLSPENHTLGTYGAAFGGFSMKYPQPVIFLAESRPEIA